MIIDIVLFLMVFLPLILSITFIFCRSNRYSGYVTRGILIGAFFRTLLTVYYYNYTLNVSADATQYYETARQGFHIENLFSPGTSFINELSAFFYLFISFFSNSYLMLYIPFSIAGFVGSLLFFKVLKTQTSLRSIELLFLSFFLPNMVFWTSNLGKDSIIYCGLMCILNGILGRKNKINFPLIVLGGVITFLIRPHVLFFLIVAFGFAFFLERNKQSGQTIFLLVLIIIAFFMVYQTLFKYLGIHMSDETENGDLVSSIYDQSIQRMERQGGNLSRGQAGTDVSPIRFLFAPFYLVNFLCAPFLWQIRKFMHLVGAVESVLYQYIFYQFFTNIKMFIKNKILPFKNTWLIFIIISSVIMGATYTNFGLSTRQRCMIIPFLILLYAMTRNDKFLLAKRRKAQKMVAAGRIGDLQIGKV